MALSSEDLQAISQLFNKRFDEIDTKLSQMATKDDIQRLDNRVSTLDDKVSTLDDKVSTLDDKVDATKQELIDRINKLETDVLNTCLGYTDEQNEIITKKLDDIQSTVNTAAKIKTIDNSVYEIINKRFEKVQKEIDEIKLMIS
ncbi:hypothetical protein DWX43_11395 [Clostridium sp. AF19-22AC]|jgi:predicted nuclease with TOPRIM domain|uniref:hypothetical protein n=1 Tax=Clostridia TaxID=186801 RepID=UPI000E4E3FD8|nr:MULTISPECIES: hypothetical protein [Clostridia]RHR29548.1 hypothetical protein DWX43_11395 [Clostridium sp. AF19-22AC]